MTEEEEGEVVAIMTLLKKNTWNVQMQVSRADLVDWYLKVHEQITCRGAESAMLPPKTHELVVIL